VKKYRFFQHTADAKFQAYGQTLEEAFQHAALAVASLMWNWERIDQKTEVPVQVDGRDLKQLLVNFLEEILYLLDTRSFLLSQVEDIAIRRKNSLYTLQAIFKGDEYSSGYEISGDVKAITYNEMVIKEKAPCMVQVVADI
jgi:SHS2 domain-containing protein